MYFYIMKKCKKLIPALLLFSLVFNSCSYPEILIDEVVYQNDFENENIENLYGASFSEFNDTKVIGDFNNDGFTLHLPDLINHDYIFISFDLYIHGSWDGNSNGFEQNDRADKWILEYRPEMDLYKKSDTEIFTTTFSNSPCWPNYCLQQSYPDTFPSNNNPKKGSLLTNLEEKCKNNFFGGPSTLYKIEKVFKSNGNSIVLRFYDELYQPNAIDKFGNVQEKCDESWSLDNLTIRIIKYQ